MPPTLEKYFTVAEAKRTLPLVRKIVADILDTGRQIQIIAETESANLEEDSLVNELEDKLNSFLYELEEIGCYYKDWNFSTGLVDFPSVINGKDVFLCWRSDEDDILYYHPVEEGYSGRTRIPDDVI